MERRRFLQISAGALALGARSLYARQALAATTLREAGAARGISVGAAIGRGHVDDPASAQLVADQFSMLVCENDMKWAATHPEQDRYEFAHADELVAFAESHGQRMRGHNLCWHVNNPKWLAAVLTPKNAAGILEDHVRTVAGRYAGKIHSWDVVNEAVLPEDKRKDGLRKSIWFDMLGAEYLEIAYRAAAAADPKALLTYNDYDIERDSKSQGRRRKAVIELLRWFRKKNIPLHAVGVQSHLKGNLAAPTWKGLNRFLNEVHDLGLDIYVTEMDVEDRELPGDIPTRDRMVGDLYRNYLDDILNHSAVKAVLTWGFTDKYTWLNSRNPREDKLLKRPLPFDADLHPTLAFDAMIAALGKS